MTRILLLRHGHVEGIVPKRFRGRQDLALSEQGHAQAVAAAWHVTARYAPVAVYTSPLRRCVESASALTAALALPAATELSGFNDIDYGAWQGRLASEVAAAEPERYALWESAPDQLCFSGDESLATVATRALGEVRSLIRLHRDQTVAVFTHDSVIRTLLLVALNAPLADFHRVSIDPCSLSELLRGEGEPTQVVRINERTDAARS